MPFFDRFARRQTNESPKVEKPSNDPLRFLLQYGVLAPANNEPWAFRLNDDAIELTIDHVCALPMGHPHHRELVLSAGVALTQLRLALGQLGYGELVELLPAPERPALLARVRRRLLGEATPTMLGRAIEQTRAAGIDGVDRVPDELLEELQAIAMAEGVAIRYATNDSAVDAIGKLNDHAARYFEEARRRAGGRLGTADRGGCFAMADSTALLRNFRAHTLRPTEGGWLEAGPNALAAPRIAVLSTEGDGALDWLLTGQALSKVLLRAHIDGVEAMLHVAPMRIPQLRSSLARMLSDGATPQLVVTFGYPTPEERVSIAPSSIPSRPPASWRPFV
jgi:hypothetical protein